jgi:hypothetical protein
MKLKLLLSAIAVLAQASFAAERPDFSGTWEFKPERSKNIGMMSQMKMSVIAHQSDSALDITTHSSFQGKDEENKTHFDLNGTPVTNESPMAGPNETVTKWDGSKLVTIWTGQSAMAGGTVVRTETRSLSENGKVMTVESVRASNPAVVMVYEKK